MARKICILIIFILVFSCTSPAYGASGDVSIVLTGDLLCDRSFQQAVGNGKTFDFDSVLKYVKPYISRADFAVGNLETCVSSSNKISYYQGKTEYCPVLNAPKSFLRSLKKTGFDGLILANNHCCDTGAKGILETVASVNNAGFKHTGLYTSSKSNHYFTLSKNGIKIGFVAYTFHFNNKHRSLKKQQQDVMLSKFDEARIKKDIAACKKAGANFIIAYDHCGDEFTYKTNSLQWQHMKTLARCGADFIVGSHPHVLQKIGSVRMTSKTVPFVYSLGNFTGNMSYKKTKESAFITLTLTKRNNGKVRIKNTRYTPVYMAKDFDGKPLALLPGGYKCKYKSTQLKIDRHFQHARDILNGKV